MAAHIDGPLYFEQMGREGTAVAMIHPNPMDQSCWIYQMGHLSTWFRCLAIDLPGYGRSPSATAELSMEDIAEGCWEAIDSVQPDGPVVLMGCSIGSALIPYLYRQRPERTGAVVLAGTGLSSDRGPSATARIVSFNEEGIDFRWRYTFQDFSAVFRATPMARYFADMFTERNATSDLATIVHQFGALAESDPRLVLEIGCPVLIVSGSEDQLHPRAIELRAAMAGSELAIIPGAGHACQVERPWEFDAVVLDFLEREGLVTR